MSLQPLGECEAETWDPVSGPTSTGFIKGMKNDMWRRVFLTVLLLPSIACRSESPFADFAGECEELERRVWENYPTEDVNAAIAYLSDAIDLAVGKADAARASQDVDEEDTCAGLVATACNVRFETSHDPQYEGDIEPACFYDTGRFLYVPPDAVVPEIPEEELGFQTIP